MKSVMLSIKPKYCELIASGKKSIEVRKTKPKIPIPFRCYIYCTTEKYKGKYLHTSNKDSKLLFLHNPDDTQITVEPDDYTYTAYTCRGKVIGEFVCDRISLYPYEPYNDGEHLIPFDNFDKICLDGLEIYDYLRCEDGYGWHISDLVIYDKPEELGEFGYLCIGDCDNCKYHHSLQGSYSYSEPTEYCNNIINHPPQSWCYVEDIISEQNAHI